MGELQTYEAIESKTKKKVHLSLLSLEYLLINMLFKLVINLIVKMIHAKILKIYNK